jgi:putative transposase
MELLDSGFEDVMTMMWLPEGMRTPLRSLNYIKRENGELERRSKVIRIFPSAASLNRLMGVVLIDRHDLMSTRNALFTKERCIAAINEIRPRLIQIAQEQSVSA